MNYINNTNRNEKYLSSRRIPTINNTKVKYLLVADTKIYEVTDINWPHSCLEAKETALSVGDVPESKLWDIGEFEDFHVRLVNGDGVGKVIDFGEWVRSNK